MVFPPEGLIGGGLQWNFWTVAQAEITALGNLYNFQEFLNWPSPYLRSTSALKIFLKAIASYACRGIFDAGVDRWLNLPAIPLNADNEAGGGLGVERTVLINVVDTCEDSSINAMIYKCKDMIEAVEYFDIKIDLGQTW